MHAADPRQEERFRRIYRRLHAGHPSCIRDEWLSEPCRLADGQPAVRPVVWSRRNGPWRRVDTLWVGAAPGNAGGKGDSALGAHGTRIPFGGDVAGANLDALFGSIGLTRNDAFLTAVLNQLPAKGGGEPAAAEVAAPAGDYPSSLHALRDTILAAGPRLVVALGNVAARAAVTAAQIEDERPRAMLSQQRLVRVGLRRGHAAAWPDAFPPAATFLREWTEAWGDAPLPHLLWLTHPSAQNMSPFAGEETGFHRRMLETRDALRCAVHDVLGWEPPARRPVPPADGIYALPEWRELVGPRHQRLDRLWREKGV